MTDIKWLRERLTSYRAMRLPVDTYEAILACLDELDAWRADHDKSSPDGEVREVNDGRTE
jgi:hypothetical protein